MLLLMLVFLGPDEHSNDSLGVTNEFARFFVYACYVGDDLILISAVGSFGVGFKIFFYNVLVKFHFVTKGEEEMR